MDPGTPRKHLNIKLNRLHLAIWRFFSPYFSNHTYQLMHIVALLSYLTATTGVVDSGTVMAIVKLVNSVHVRLATCLTFQ